MNSERTGCQLHKMGSLKGQGAGKEKGKKQWFH